MIMRSSVSQSPVWSRRGLYWKIQWSPQHHVVQSTRVSSHECYHLKTSFQVGEGFGAKSTKKASFGPIHSSSTKSLMITSSMPCTTKHEDVIEQLSRLLSRSNVQVRAERNPAVIILATPTFATWLENKPFMSKVLEKIFIDGCGTTNNLSSDVTVLVAAVDGLPPRNQKTMGNGLQVTEGFAFLSCDQELVLPRIWEQDNLNDLADEGYSQRPSIVFRMSSGSSLKGVLDIGVPLANTMFRNGRTSTLLASSWHRNNASGQFEKVKQVERKSMIIYPASANSMIPLRLEIPLVPLTPFRRVVSGLGNILRQVTDAHGKVVSASQELEASVDTYLDARKLQKQAVAVWALITPNSEMVDKKNEDILATDQDRIRASWTNTAEQGLLPYVGSWIKQGRGGTLHRVLSGGGGWGLKQGLLSLDPDTTLLKSTDARHDFDSDDPGDNEHVQALGKIAKPGSWVQFLVSHHSTSETHIATVGLNNSNLDSEFINCLSFGCIPSTVDDTSQSLSDPSISSDEKDFHRSVDGLEGHFGAMSEGGIFICANEKDAVTSSKIDVPYSIFQWGLIKREKS